MRPGGVVVGHPGGNRGAGLGKAGEHSLVQQFVAHPAVEAFDVAVLHGLAGRDVVPLDPVVLCPFQHGRGGQFRPVVGDDHPWLAPPDHQLSMPTEVSSEVPK